MGMLLVEGFARLVKSKAFWFELAAAVSLSAFTLWANYAPDVLDRQLPLDEVMFTFSLLAGLVFATSTSLIVGTEYSDGTMRNKLVVGHSRASVYFSNLAVCTAATFAAMALHVLVILAFGTMLFEPPVTPALQLIRAEGCVLLACFSTTAICLALSMNCSNKSTSVAACMVLIVALMYASSFASARLAEPPTVYESVTITAEEGVQYGELMENPAYVEGSARTALEWVEDALPIGQINQIHSLEFDRSARWPWLSLGLYAAASALGFALFRKKDLR